MANSGVLIVGAGALGMVTGYHLNLAGATVTFLVRSPRLQALQEPQVLYCYDDGQLKTFSDYKAVDSVAEAGQQAYDFVLVTLDGATCKTTEATAMLAQLGDAIRDTGADVVVCGMGVRDHCREVMRLHENRVAEGTMGIFSYQVSQVDMPLHPPTDPAQLAQASMAYRHASGKMGFMMAGKPKAAAKAFAQLYNNCGVSHCGVVPAGLYTVFTKSFAPNMAAFDLAGWPDAKAMVENRELLTLCSSAMKEIMRLPQHGLIGKLPSLFISPSSVAKNITKGEAGSLPLDYVGFCKFHHGGKVREQNIQIMRDAAQSAREQRVATPALDEMLARWEAHIKAQA